MKRIFAILTMSMCVAVAMAQNEPPMGPPPGGFGTPPPGGFGTPPPGGPGPGGGGSQYVTAQGVETYSADATVSGKTVAGSEADHSAVLCNGGTLHISNSTLSNSADATSTDDASFYGINAVLLAQPKDKQGSCTIYSEHNRIAGSGLGTNGIFAYGGGIIYSTGDRITQTGGNTRGIMCSGGGTIHVAADTVDTSGHSSSCVATDRGGGTIYIKGGQYTCHGTNSAGIYSTGVINAEDATFVSTGGEAIVIEGTNYVNATNCHFTAKADKWGVLLYQSFSGDAEEGDRATLSVKGGSITYEGTKCGMFYNTNNRDSLYLENVKLVNAGDTIVNSKKGSWGNTDSARRGGTLSVACNNQKLEGLVCADSDSQVNLYLANGSTFTGSINPIHVAKAASIHIDGTSKWVLTTDAYVIGKLELPEQPNPNVPIKYIQGDGNNIYYLTSANPQLQGKKYWLANGGHLKPVDD